MGGGANRNLDETHGESRIFLGFGRFFAYRFGLILALFERNTVSFECFMEMHFDRRMVKKKIWEWMSYLFFPGELVRNGSLVLWGFSQIGVRNEES